MFSDRVIGTRYNRRVDALYYGFGIVPFFVIDNTAPVSFYLYSQWSVNIYLKKQNLRHAVENPLCASVLRRIDVIVIVVKSFDAQRSCDTVTLFT